MNKDILLWTNIEIINVLEKWGVLTVRHLQSLLCSNISINALRKRLHKLAVEDFVEISRLGINNEMIAVPTKKALHRLKSNRSSIDEAMIYHNLFISLLGLELISREKVEFFKHPHEYRKSKAPITLSSSIEPDAYLCVKHNDENLKVAIEIELTQKSSDRIYEKFKQYKDSAYFSYVIYFFRDESTLNSYRKRLEEIANEMKNKNDKNELLGKVIFLYSKQKHQYGSILENSIMEYGGKIISVTKFFGVSTTVKELIDENNNSIGAK